MSGIRSNFRKQFRRTNHDLWIQIEKLPMFSDENHPVHDDAWDALAKIQDSRTILSAVQIKMIYELLKLAQDAARYENGVNH